MTNEKLYEVLGDINENYVKEAGANPKAEKRRRFKWKVIAACLCLLLAAPLTVFAMDTKANTGDIRTGQGIDTDHDARRGPFIFGRYPGHRFRHLHIYL